MNVVAYASARILQANSTAISIIHPRGHGTTDSERMFSCSRRDPHSSLGLRTVATQTPEGPRTVLFPNSPVTRRSPLSHPSTAKFMQTSRWRVESLCCRIWWGVWRGGEGGKSRSEREAGDTDIPYIGGPSGSSCAHSLLPFPDQLPRSVSPLPALPMPLIPALSTIRVVIAA